MRDDEDERYSYDDDIIFDMRRNMLLRLRQVMDMSPRHVKVLRIREFDLNPNVVVMDLVKEYGLVLDDDYSSRSPRVDPMLGGGGGGVDVAPSTYSCAADRPKWEDAIHHRRIDWTLEGYFGHNRLDCRSCRDNADTRHHRSSSTVVPTSIYVLGERNSGTTFVSNTLAMAFDPPNAMGSDLEKFSIDVPVLLHKHMFRHDLLDDGELGEIRSRDDVLWIMVVRSPCDW